MPQLKSENELEDYLYGDSELECYGDCFRQVPIKGYGIIDLLYIHIDNDPAENRPLISITIVELKKDYIDLNALGQICRYKIALERFFENSKHNLRYEIKGVLVGSDYASGDICFTVDAIDWLSCYHYSISLTDGISFSYENGWYRDDECFASLNKLAKSFLTQYKEVCRDLIKYKKYIKADK
ncbi:hypothetical protein KAR91_66495 [Candidatus Pacearchaeota archaeon]|nr:hypothetical protein [Candidatus Pacearchaeota archaeon]